VSCADILALAAREAVYLVRTHCLINYKNLWCVSVSITQLIEILHIICGAEIRTLVLLDI
jgi:hypothetical protein